MTIEHHKSIKINVVIPSHVRALATVMESQEFNTIDFCCHTLSCEGVSNTGSVDGYVPKFNVVIPSHVRALATKYSVEFPQKPGCHTLSCEGVSNTRDANGKLSFELSYPLM